MNRQAENKALEAKITSVYLAARYRRRKELLACCDELEQLGIAVTSGWLRRETSIETKDLTPDDWRCFAQEDVEDVRRADALVLFAEEESGGAGGRHVEFGIALGLWKPIIVVGRTENLFQHLPEVRLTESWNEGIDLLKQIAGLETS